MHRFTRIDQKLAARRRLFKHNGVRAAIERGWWPYLPLRWVVLNDKEILKVTHVELAKRGKFANTWVSGGVMLN